MRSPAGFVTSPAPAWTRRLVSGSSAKAELVLEADRAQQSERVVQEHPGRLREATSAEVGEAAEGIERLAARERPRDRVDREVAGGEIPWMPSGGA